MPTPVAAANAYANLARLTGSGGGLTMVLGDPPAGPSFDALVKEALATVVEAGRKSDTQAQAGKANMVDLVTAVAESETAIATLVSVRDRVIQAYQTILQMPI